MRIAYLSTYPPTPCGVAEYTRSLVEALKTLANSVEIVILSDKVGGLEERVDEELRDVLGLCRLVYYTAMGVHRKLQGEGK